MYSPLPTQLRTIYLVRIKRIKNCEHTIKLHRNTHHRQPSPPLWKFPTHNPHYKTKEGPIKRLSINKNNHFCVLSSHKKKADTKLYFLPKKNYFYVPIPINMISNRPTEHLDLDPHIIDCVDSIHALSSCTLANMRPFINEVLIMHDSKEALSIIVDKLRDRAIIAFARGLNQNHPERIRTEMQARSYTRAMMSRESLSTLKKRINGEIILEDPTQQQEVDFAIQSARIEPISESVFHEIRDQIEDSGCLELIFPWRWFNRRRY